MSSWVDHAALVLGLLIAAGSHAQAPYPGIGRAATPAEVAAWDIDGRPDFQGLPPGSGTVARGQAVWEAQCASCHGIFGESNEVFSPLIGGTTAGLAVLVLMRMRRYLELDEAVRLEGSEAP